MSKRTRQQAIVELVSSKRVASQAILADELRELGFEVTQATLSRDISELNLVKTKEGYSRPQDASLGGLPPAPDPHGTMKRLVTKVETACNLVILKTSMGGANPVAIAIDEGDHPEVVGTIAGDDTVFIATQSAADAERFASNLSDLLK